MAKVISKCPERGRLFEAYHAEHRMWCSLGCQLGCQFQREEEKPVDSSAKSEIIDK